MCQVLVFHRRVLLCSNYIAKYEFGVFTKGSLLCSTEAQPDKFTVGMLDNPLRVGVPFQVRLAISPAWMRFLCCIVPDIVIVCFADPSEFAGRIQQSFKADRRHHPSAECQVC